MSIVGKDPEETEETIRIPNPGVGDCEVTATITIDEDKGIKAVYCGESKEIRTYLFEKDKTWTMETAQAWVDEHKEDVGDIFLARLVELDMQVKALDAGDQEGPRTDDERAQAHFDITEEVWETLPDKAKTALKAALPERGEGEDAMTEEEIKDKIEALQKQINEFYEKRERVDPVDYSEVEPLYAEIMAYKEALAELIKAKVLSQEDEGALVDEVARSKRLLSDPRLRRESINVHAKTS